MYEMNAYNALLTLRKDFDVENNDFFILKDGIQILCDVLYKNLLDNNVNIIFNSTLNNIDDKQKNISENSKKKKDKSGKFDSPIVTEITKASTYYPAEDYHQDFFENNKTYGYCRAVIWPKLAKLGMLKEE